MLKKLMLIAMTAGAIGTTLPAPAAEARVQVARSGVVYTSRSVVHVRRLHHRRFVAPIYFASPVVYTNGCYWLKRRAIETGSRYWWRRYRHCRGY